MLLRCWQYWSWPLTPPALTKFNVEIVVCSYVQRFRSPFAKKFEIFRSHAHVQICRQGVRSSNSATSPWYPTSIEIRADCIHEGGSQQRPKSIAKLVFMFLTKNYQLGRIKQRCICLVQKILAQKLRKIRIPHIQLICTIQTSWGWSFTGQNKKSSLQLKSGLLRLSTAEGGGTFQ